MKKQLFGGLLILTLVITATAFTLPTAPEDKYPAGPATETVETDINWISWDAAIKANATKPKKIFVDLYTDWCGWCKKMDQTTFKDPAVVKYMNENFYAVKFDAEGKEDVLYKGNTFKYIPAGRRGVHALAYALLDGKLSYPSYVYLDEDHRRITISPGYKTADQFIKELKYIGTESYTKLTYQDYLNQSR